MRTPPVHCRAVQVTSPTGELKRIPVSGLNKLRLLWLFRNFSILDFSVLTQKQQQLIAHMWHAAPGGRSAGASLDLIGCIEGFSTLQLATAAKSTAPAQVAKPSASTPGDSPEARPKTAGEDAKKRPASLRPSWTFVAALVLLACALYLRLPHRRQLAPPPTQSATQHLPVQAPPASAPAIAVRSRGVDPPSSSIAVAEESASSAPEVKMVVSPAPPLPNAMAREQLPAPRKPRVANTVPQKMHPEVLIRVRVDEQGRPQSFEVMQGKGRKTAAAIAAAKRWSFHPCSGSDGCEHLLKFTDYGDTSQLQVID